MQVERKSTKRVGKNPPHLRRKGIKKISYSGGGVRRYDSGRHKNRNRSPLVVNNVQVSCLSKIFTQLNPHTFKGALTVSAILLDNS